MLLQQHQWNTFIFQICFKLRTVWVRYKSVGPIFQAPLGRGLKSIHNCIITPKNFFSVKVFNSNPFMLNSTLNYPAISVKTTSGANSCGLPRRRASTFPAPLSSPLMGTWRVVGRVEDRTAARAAALSPPPRPLASQNHRTTALPGRLLTSWRS
jgi:hypothetical protein